MWHGFPPNRLRIARQAGKHHEPDAHPWLEQFGIPPLQVIEKHRAIWIYAPADAPTEKPP
jgi:hypothetical protein